MNGDVDRWPTYSYYLENGKYVPIRLLGIRDTVIGNTSKVDTIFNETVSPTSTLFLLSGVELIPPPFSAPMFKSIGIHECDTIYLFEENVISRFYVNPHKDSSPVPDSLSILFQFDDRTKYISFETIEFNSEGPQPKEIKYKFRIE